MFVGVHVPKLNILKYLFTLHLQTHVALNRFGGLVSSSAETLAEKDTDLL